MTNLVLLGAGPNQIPAIEEAHKLGIKVLAIDKNPKADGFKTADWSFVNDIKFRPENNNNSYLICLMEYLEDFNKKNGIDGVMTLGVEVPEIVSEIVDRFYLPGISRVIAKNMVKKQWRYLSLKNHVAIPKFYHPGFAVHNQDWRITKETVPMPAVLKLKMDRSAGEDVYYIESLTDLKNYPIKENDNGGNYMLEEYIDGHELSTESVVLSGGSHIDFIADRNYDKKFNYKPYMIEDGCSVPSIISKEHISKVNEAISRVIEVFELKYCILKCDLIIKENTVYVLECTPRLSGGRLCSHIVPQYTGINLVQIAILMATANNNFIKITPHEPVPIAQRYYFPDGKEIKSHRDRGPDFIASGNTLKEAIEKTELMVSEYGKLQENKTLNSSPHQRGN